VCSRTTCKTVWLEHFRSHIDIYDQHFRAWLGLILWRLWLNRKGPRVVALVGGLLYGGGVYLASFSDHKLWWLYLSYGVIGGIGLGFSYIVPVAVLVKWFPERRGLITGIAVGGFGAGALITAPVATRLIQSYGVLSTFAYLGCRISDRDRNLWLFHGRIRLTTGSRKDGRPLPHKSRKDPAVITRWEKPFEPGNGGRCGCSCF